MCGELFPPDFLAFKLKSFPGKKKVSHVRVGIEKITSLDSQVVYRARGFQIMLLCLFIARPQHTGFYFVSLKHEFSLCLAAAALQEQLVMAFNSNETASQLDRKPLMF